MPKVCSQVIDIVECPQIVDLGVARSSRAGGTTFLPSRAGFRPGRDECLLRPDEAPGIPWYPRSDSNRQALRRGILNPLRLPFRHSGPGMS